MDHGRAQILLDAVQQQECRMLDNAGGDTVKRPPPASRAGGVLALYCEVYSAEPCRLVCAFHSTSNGIEMLYVDYADQRVHPYEVVLRSGMNECMLADDGTWVCDKCKLLRDRKRRREVVSSDSTYYHAIYLEGTSVPFFRAKSRDNNVRKFKFDNVDTFHGHAAVDLPELNKDLLDLTGHAVALSSGPFRVWTNDYMKDLAIHGLKASHSRLLCITDAIELSHDERLYSLLYCARDGANQTYAGRFWMLSSKTKDAALPAIQTPNRIHISHGTCPQTPKNMS